MKINSSWPRFFISIFFVVSFLDVAAIFFSNTPWQTISKPLIIPALMACYITGSKSWNKLYVLALFFSFTGDVLLMDKNNLFLFGIASFLLTQLLYVFIVAKQLVKSDGRTVIAAILPFLIFFLTLIAVLKPGLGDFFVPVLVYGLAISVFGVVVFINYLQNKDKPAIRLLAGALLFIASDSMIALNKFHEERAFYGVSVMITYILAQYLIYTYMIRLKVPVQVLSDNS
jgi:uncharacterized membrane protein YhhN